MKWCFLSSTTDSLQLTLVSWEIMRNFKIEKLLKPHLFSTPTVISLKFPHFTPTFRNHLWCKNWRTFVNPLSAKPTKWSSTLKQFVTDESFECVRPFYGFVTYRVNCATPFCKQLLHFMCFHLWKIFRGGFRSLN